MPRLQCTRAVPRLDSLSRPSPGADAASDGASSSDKLESKGSDGLPPTASHPPLPELVEVTIKKGGWVLHMVLHSVLQ